MAIYHLSAKIIGRSAGRSAVGAAAYRSGTALVDNRLGLVQDHSAKDDVIHSEVMLPDGAPERLRDRGTLWNEVEAVEKRKDAQLAREIEVAIPRELTRKQAMALARDFVAEQFVAKGMVADLNVHWSVGEDGEAKPHAHVMLSTREVGPEGFGKKVVAWNAKAELKQWREAWADLANTRLAELGHEARIDHRSLDAQGIELSPQHKIGPAGARREERGEDAERAAEHRAIARANGERIMADPSIALRTLTHQQATFTREDLAKLIHRHSDGQEQFAGVMARVEASPELVRLGKDARWRERWTTREMVEVERRLEGHAEGIAGRGHGVDRRHREAVLASRELGVEQRAAYEHVTGERGLALVVGYAGTGKSTMLGAAREAWEAQGYSVRGAALSGIAAESLEGGSGIRSRTLASFEHGWGQGRDQLTARDVLVIDEAGLVGSRQLERVLGHAAAVGAKVVLVGDPEQLQAIEAGAGFRALVERHGAAEITQVRRQRVEWQREATVALATGGTGEALARYAEAGMVVAHATRAAAREALVERWDARGRAHAGESTVMLAYTHDDVRGLNELARERVRAAGGLGVDVEVATERGTRAFAQGDRVMFLRNGRELGVRNGTLGVLRAIESGGERLTVAIDGQGQEERDVTFYARDYAHIDHGYAATVHKAQGVTVDRAYVLASEHLDRHATYVGLTRHRDGVELHYGRDDFADPTRLARMLGRERAKDSTLDYAAEQAPDQARAADPVASFAERRGIVSEIIAQVKQAVPSKERVFARFGKAIGRGEAGHRAEEAQGGGRFVGLQIGAGGEGRAHEPSPRPERVAGPIERALRDYAEAWEQARRMEEQRLPVLAHQRQALAQAGGELNRVRGDGARDLASALDRNPALARGDAGALAGAMEHEGQVRRDPNLRAGRFIERWRAAEKEGARERLGELAGELKRDPQIESVLRARGRVPGEDRLPQLEKTLDIGLGRSRERGIEM